MPLEDSDKLVQLGHGAGGLLQSKLIEFITQTIVQKRVGNGVGVESFDDGATIPLENYNFDVVVTADGHTVDPPVFPGGDLGKLSVCGTVNDLIMMGAKPLALTSIVLIEEGVKFSFLKSIMDSFNATAEEAGVAIIAGDTKVMPKGSMKGIVITTTGIGIKPKSVKILDSNCKPGSKIIITGSIGDHGIALLAKREGIQIQTDLVSDVAHLMDLYEIIKDQPGISAMKDPTRGGLSATLNEWASKSNISIWVNEQSLPIKKEVKAVADILGLDPLEIANEGKAVICIDATHAETLLTKIRTLPLGKDAQIIGEIKAERPKMVFMQTLLGGTRMIEMPMGEPIPRIC
jgi:hydrogenase expression/formation protein HypE